MKKCPLCAEEIQDNAIRCKHCGGDLETHASAQQNQKAEQNAKSAADLWNKIAISSLIVIGAISGYLVASKVSSSLLKIVEGIAISAFLFPISWKLGKVFGKLAQPNIILSNNVIDLALRRIGYYFLPLAFAIVGGIGSLYVMANIVRDQQTQKDATLTNSSAQVAGPSENTTKPIDAPPPPKPAEQPSTPPAAVAAPNPTPPTTPSAEITQLSLQATWVPSFDCTKASTFSENAICTDPLLGKLDGALAENYKLMLASDIGDGARNDLKATQRKWLAERNKCTENQCLVSNYRKRMDEVCEYPVISGVHPICTSSDEIK